MAGFRWIEGVGGEVVADGKRLEAVAYGPPPEKAPTIVMLHEGLGCVKLWRDFPAKLAAATGWGAFAYSRAGYGGSDPVELPRPLDYMEREARFSLPTVLGAIRFQRGILLGHSDGASIAAIYAGERFDGRVKGLVLMAPTSSPRSRASPQSRRRSALTKPATCARSSPVITPMSTAPSWAGTKPGSIRGSRPGTSRMRSAAGASPRC
jgi:pimeloyl-ACP methyl ester carboxylesterase